jgi:hypothetical protein
MAFCRQCGSPVEGAFCPKCGAKLDAAGAPGAQPPQVPPAASGVEMPPAGAPRKKGRWIFWTLGGCALLVVIIVLILVFGGIFIAKKAGIDTELMQKNPSLAMAKIIASTNPDIEVLSVDENRGIIRARDKKTGKTVTLDLQNAKQGKIVFSDDQNQKVEIKTQGEGENASMEIKSSEGTMRMGTGAAAQLPNWLPSYPGAEAAGGLAFNQGNGNSGSCAFKTKDSVEAVGTYYENALKNAGFTVQKSVTQIPNQGTMISLSATENANKRTANVTAAHTNEGTTINLMFEAK